ncbi:heavy-metal-associated domain-containing protein [Tissierella sp.]|uniref:heavy-metal-associated domain-containing protein n=1 Tax=Tissierella sp. TaxID=41274 RepID=UPI002861F5FF|nr:heavy-metal-associated domain-containing protein [Tissierella sp.]MDR7854988.1 heavy-metal-associated domain-containing protein [Tissierella sp.]
MKKKVLIEGMSCGNCVRHVAEALNEIDGVSNVAVKLEEKYALMDVESNDLDEAIKFAVDEAGYEVVGIEAV